MTSRSSFWGSMIENSKRRIWVWALSMLSFVLVLPTHVAFAVNRQAGRIDDYVRDYGQKLGEQRIRQNMLDVAKECLSSSVLLIVLVCVVAFLIAVQGFSWLYNRKKIDFYMGMPVKRSKRFLIIWLNGFLIFVVPYLLGIGVSLLITAANDIFSVGLLIDVILAAGRSCLLFLGVYHLAILALMLTGNVVITVCAFGVFCLYECMIRTVIYSYKQLFFEHFSYQSMSTEAFLSPFTMYSELLKGIERGYGYGGYLIGMLLFAMGVGVLSYVCYLKRPAEAVDKAITFHALKPIAKILLMVPITLFAGYLMADSVNYKPAYSQEGIGFVIFTYVAVVIVGCALLQVIYEFDIKGALHKKFHIVIAGLSVAFIFLIFSFDFFQYDAYVPNPDKVESVAFVPANYEAAAGYSSHVDEWGEYISNWEYARENMFLQDVEAVCELAELSMEEYKQMKQLSELENLKADEFYKGDMELNYWSYASVIYRLKNGREVCREFKINMMNEEAVTYLDRIIGEPAFKKGYLDGASEKLITLLENNEKYAIEAYYGNTIYSSKMSREDAADFLKVYQTELKDANFSVIREKVPAGVLLIDVTQTNKDGGRWTRTIGINVYEFMEESISCLREKGYYVEEHLNPRDVERIQVINYNSEARERLKEQKIQSGEENLEAVEVTSVRMEMAESGGTDVSVYKDYVEPEQIAEIAEMLYPNDLLNHEWDGGTPRDDEYEVQVYFKNGTKISKEFGITAYYGFVKGLVPSFVQEDTIYKE